MRKGIGPFNKTTSQFICLKKLSVKRSLAIQPPQPSVITEHGSGHFTAQGTWQGPLSFQFGTKHRIRRACFVRAINN